MEESTVDLSTSPAVDGSRGERSPSGRPARPASCGSERPAGGDPVEPVLGQARALAAAIARTGVPERDRHSLRLARALVFEVIDLLESVRRG